MNAQRDSASVPVSSWCSARLFVTDEFAAPPVILRVDDSVIGTLGNFSASTGKAKSKKTFNVCAIVAAAMTGGTVLNYSASLPPERRRILYVDTEQSRFHCKRVLCRILRLAGLPTDVHPPLLEFLCLRGYATKERLRKIEEAIYDLDDLGLVVIDGIRDLAHDINSPGEATDLITKLMQWTDERRIHIHTVLHLNKGDDNTRGHLGTELNNKAETVLQITKDDFDRDISSVAAMHIRDRDFEPFAFRINADALPELVEETTNLGRLPPPKVSTMPRSARPNTARHWNCYSPKLTGFPIRRLSDGCRAAMPRSAIRSASTRPSSSKFFWRTNG